MKSEKWNKKGFYKLVTKSEKQIWFTNICNVNICLEVIKSQIQFFNTCGKMERKKRCSKQIKIVCFTCLCICVCLFVGHVSFSCQHNPKKASHFMVSELLVVPTTAGTTWLYGIDPKHNLFYLKNGVSAHGLVLLVELS